MQQPSGLYAPGDVTAGITPSGNFNLLPTGDPNISMEGRAVLTQSGSLPNFGLGGLGGGARFGSQSTGQGTSHGRSSGPGGGVSVSMSGVGQGAGLRLAMPDDDDGGQSACHSTMAAHHAQQRDTRPENSLHDGSGLRVSIGGTVYLGGELIVTASGAHINGVPASTLKPQDFVEDGRILGRGISGQVRRMLHRATGERIAVKEIALGKSDIAMQNVKRELRTLFLAKQRGTGLTAPQAVRRGAAYLVDFYGAWANQGSVFIAMECMDGSLGDFRDVPCPENVAARITAQVVRGLKFLHEEAFLVHRDLKPPNILFSRKGLAKITDFGLTAQLSDDRDGRTSSFVGSVMYMSPERLRGETYSLSADVWALGITIAEIVLGFHPFAATVAGGHGQQDTFWKLLEIYGNGCETAHRLLRDAAQKANLSPGFIDFVLQCTHADEAQRPACSDLLFHHWLTTCGSPPGVTEVHEASTLHGSGTPGLQTFGAASGSPGLAAADADSDFRGFSSDDDDDDSDSRGPPGVSNDTIVFDGKSPSALGSADAAANTTAMAADPAIAAWLTEIIGAAASGSSRSVRLAAVAQAASGNGAAAACIPEQA